MRPGETPTRRYSSVTLPPQLIRPRAMTKAERPRSSSMTSISDRPSAVRRPAWRTAARCSRGCGAPDGPRIAAHKAAPCAPDGAAIVARPILLQLIPRAEDQVRIIVSMPTGRVEEREEVLRE